MSSAATEVQDCQDMKPAASLKTGFLKTELWKKVLFLLICTGMGFLLGRIRLLGGISPFGPALVAACYTRGRPEMLAAAAGACLGALLIGHDALFVICVVLLVCGALLAVGPGRRWMAVMITACAYAVSALVFKTADLEVFMTAVLECLMALVMIYVIGTLMQLTGGKKRTMLSAEETICLALGALALICMFGQLNVGGI